MDMTRPIHLMPTMEMIAECLTLAGWQFTAQMPDPQQTFRGVRLFIGQPALQEDILYALRPGEQDFPTDAYAYVCTSPTPGSANHLCCDSQGPEQVLDALMELFSRYQHQELLIDQLSYRQGSLDELCQLASELLGNPVCIHDDWFIMVGASRDAEAVMTPEYSANSTYGTVPRAIVNDFRYDSDYLETYSHPDAQIWEEKGGVSSLYVNLWDGNLYRGRMLVLLVNRPVRREDFILAEVLAQRAIFLITFSPREAQPRYQSMDDRVFALLEGRQTDAAQLQHLLTMLGWEPGDRFGCVRLKPQQASPNVVMERLLHGDLFRLFPGSYIILDGREQCLVLNLTRNPLPLTRLRHMLAPVCRDYCLYAGISSPVEGIREIHLAHYQAGAALQQAFRLHNEKWILSFSECTLEFLVDHLEGPLTARHLVVPALLTLREHDREKGSQYFDTLRTYLLLDRDIPKTAQALIIHRTTLLYRLKKLQTMLAVNLEDPWVRLNLMLSLWILEQEKSG